MRKYIVTADLRVKDQLKEALDFFNS